MQLLVVVALEGVFLIVVLQFYVVVSQVVGRRRLPLQVIRRALLQLDHVTVVQELLSVAFAQTSTLGLLFLLGVV